MLVDAVEHRAIDRDLWLVGLDGAMAAWALGRLRAADSVDALSTALVRDDPVLKKVRSASFSPVVIPGTGDGTCLPIPFQSPSATCAAGCADACSGWVLAR